MGFALKPLKNVFVALLHRVILTAKVTLRTFCTYEHHLQTMFMERHPDVTHQSTTVWLERVRTVELVYGPGPLVWYGRFTLVIHDNVYVNGPLDTGTRPLTPSGGRPRLIVK